MIENMKQAYIRTSSEYGRQVAATTKEQSWDLFIHDLPTAESALDAMLEYDYSIGYNTGMQPDDYQNPKDRAAYVRFLKDWDLPTPYKRPVEEWIHLDEMI